MYVVYFQPKAKKDYDWLEKKDHVTFVSVGKELGAIMEDPYGESVRLIDPYFYGFRRARASGDRIRFQLCEECRKEQRIRRERQCVDCEDIPVNGIKIFNIEPRRSAYKKK